MVAEIRIVLDIALILITAKIFGEIAERFKVSHIVGEILAGVLVGPVLLLIHPNSLEPISVFSLIGIILLLYLIGLEIKFEDIKKDVYSGTYIALVAAIVSLISGLALGFILFESMDIGIIIGIVLMGTSTSIPIKILYDKGELKTRVGKILVTTAMADDIITLIALAAASTFFTLGIFQIWQIIGLVFTVIGFIVVALTVGEKVSNAVLSLIQKLKDEQMLLSIPLVTIFVVAFVSQRIGVAAVTGAFLAGMAMSKSKYTEDYIEPKIKAIGYGFFIPIFFAYSAVIIDPSIIVDNLWIIAAITVVGIVIKSAATGWFSGLFGMRSKEKKIMAIGMVPRGEYGIMISQLALSIGIIGAALYGSLIVFVAISAIITPILFRFLVYEERRFGR